MEPKPRVLIIEREEAASVPFEEKLRSADLVTVERCLPTQAAKAVERAVPDLLVIDVDCPSPTCGELCETVRRLVEPSFMPVVMLTDEDVDSVQRGFDAGADECIRRSCGVHETIARVRSLLRMKTRHEELCRRNEELTELSTRDELTGLNNRRYLFEHMAAEVERAVRYQHSLSCIMIDVDGFKAINDTHGHLVGDALFRRATEVFRSVPRRIDISFFFFFFKKTFKIPCRIFSKVKKKHECIIPF
jgi:two-component system cell cycle response regulator